MGSRLRHPIFPPARPGSTRGRQRPSPLAFAQQHRLLLITSNRNKEDEVSLEATIERENRPLSLPVITLSRANRLAFPDYRQQAALKLAEIIIYLNNYLGVGRIYIP